jgi:hypothetical protein
MKREQPRTQKQITLHEGLDANLVTLQQEATIDGKPQRRTFSMMAYTGAPVQRWYGQLVFDLAGVKTKARTPILLNHDSTQIAGQAESIAVDASGIRISGRLMSRTESAKHVADLADDGFAWQASVGMQFDEVEELKAGKTEIVNGREICGPAYIARKATLRESSFVPIGADGDTSSDVLSLCGITGEDAPMPNDTAPDVAKLSADAQASGVKAERDRFAALSTKFNDAAFIVAQFSAGATVEQAELAWKDKRLSDLEALAAKLEKENAELKAQPAPTAAPATTQTAAGVPPVQFSASAGTPEGAGDFMAQAKSLAAAEKLSLGKAVEKLASEQPELHRAWLAAQPKRSK